MLVVQRSYQKRKINPLKTKRLYVWLSKNTPHLWGVFFFTSNLIRNTKIPIFKLLLGSNGSPLSPATNFLEEIPYEFGFGMALVKMTLSLVFLLVFFTISLWFLKKLLAKKSNFLKGSTRIVVSEIRPISSKTTLFLVKVDDKEVLLAESQLELRKIENLTSLRNLENNPLEDPTDTLN
jgi:flagellar biogenesis protein FliO